jgi:hypothetical protein
VLIKRQLQKRLERPFVKRLSKNIRIKEVILKNSRKSPRLMKFFLIQKKDRSMMNMAKKELKMVVLQEGMTLVVYLTYSEGKKDRQVQEKESQS